MQWQVLSWDGCGKLRKRKLHRAVEKREKNEGKKRKKRRKKKKGKEEGKKRRQKKKKKKDVFAEAFQVWRSRSPQFAHFRFGVFF